MCTTAGEVTEKHTEKATIESKGKPITKDGDPENPNFKVERKGKNPVIKRVCSGPGTLIPSLQCVLVLGGEAQNMVAGRHYRIERLDNSGIESGGCVRM